MNLPECVRFTGETIPPERLTNGRIYDIEEKATLLARKVFGEENVVVVRNNHGTHHDIPEGLWEEATLDELIRQRLEENGK